MPRKRFPKAMRKTLGKALILLLTCAGASAEPVPFHASAPSLPLANGAVTAVYDVAKGEVVDFYTHPYKKYTPTEITADLCMDTHLGPQAKLPLKNLEYLDGSGILHEQRGDGQRQVDRYFFAPLPTAADGYPDRLLVMLVRMENVSAAPLPMEALGLFDFRVGAGGQPNPTDNSDLVSHQWTGQEGETLVGQDDGSWLESAPGQPHKVYYRPLGQWEEDSDQFTLGLLADWTAAPGEAKWMGVVVAHDEIGADLAKTVDAYLAGRGPEALLAGEEKAWESFHAVEPDLSKLDPNRRAVYRQSTACLKMGQVRERERPNAEGQVLASVKDKWARAWARDGSYAIAGLARSGHVREARGGLDFMLRTRKEEGRDYLALINETLPPERHLDDYLISVCRYWGNGMEESDWNDAGPNIEYDDWGLFLWAFVETVEAMPEAEGAAYLKKNLAAVEKGVAEPLIRLTGDNGLLAPDSSIWERHWNLPLQYDGRRHHTYSNLAAANGLARLAPHSSQPERYRMAAERIQKGVVKNLSHAGGGLASCLEELQSNPARAWDSSVLEAVNWDLVPDEKVLTTLHRNLGSRTPGSPGLCRNDDGTSYDSAEWLLLDLRVAAAWCRLGHQDRYEALMDWTTGWANANYNTMGELLDEKGNFEGPFPMTGFGPGAYILAVDANRQRRPDGDTK